MIDHKRNVAIATALDALGVDTGTTPNLSPIQQKILRVLMHGDREPNQQWASWEMEYPNLRTVVLPVLKERGLIHDTVEHKYPAMIAHEDGRPRLPPVHHRDIAITEIGMLVLYRFEQKLLGRIGKFKQW